MDARRSLIAPETQNMIIGDEKPITARPADNLAPGMEAARGRLKT